MPVSPFLPPPYSPFTHSHSHSLSNLPLSFLLPLPHLLPLFLTSDMYTSQFLMSLYTPTSPLSCLYIFLLSLLSSPFFLSSLFPLTPFFFLPLLVPPPSFLLSPSSLSPSPSLPPSLAWLSYVRSE